MAQTFHHDAHAHRCPHPRESFFAQPTRSHRSSATLLPSPTFFLFFFFRLVRLERPLSFLFLFSSFECSDCQVSIDRRGAGSNRRSPQSSATRLASSQPPHPCSRSNLGVKLANVVLLGSPVHSWNHRSQFEHQVLGMVIKTIARYTKNACYMESLDKTLRYTLS